LSGASLHMLMILRGSMLILAQLHDADNACPRVTETPLLCALFVMPPLVVRPRSDALYRSQVSVTRDELADPLLTYSRYISGLEKCPTLSKSTIPRIVLFRPRLA